LGYLQRSRSRQSDYLTLLLWNGTSRPDQRSDGCRFAPVMQQFAAPT